MNLSLILLAALAADRPNVLFIAVDDLRPELGCYGADPMRTPALDRFAGTALRFERAYCQQAVCSPSRTSLMTGRRPATTGVHDLNTHFRKNLPDVVTLSQHFKDHGYHAVGMGKIYHGSLDDPASWSVPHRRPKAPLYGDPEIQADLVRQRKAKRGRKPAQVAERDPETGLALKIKRDYRAKSNGPSWEAADVADEVFHDGQLAGMAVRTLGRMADTPKPFFLAVGFVRPHLPFVAPRKYFDLYPKEGIGLSPNPNAPADVPPIALHDFGELRQYQGIPKGKGPLPDQQARDLRRAYYAATSYVDAQIGRVIDELDRLGLAEDTIVVVWGDHGWHLGDQGLWCKHSNFERAARVPLLLRVPGRTSGESTPALVELVDVYPTLCEAAGLPLPEGLEGTSMMPLTDDPRRPWKSAAFFEYPRGNRMGHSIRTDRYRYTAWTGRDGAVVARELYDHQADPLETANLADRPEQAERVADLQRRLDGGWQAARSR